MAIALVKSAKGSSALATTTASFASATTAGNLIVLAFASDDYNGSPGAGWTQSTGMEQQTFHGGYIWWRISTGETNFSYTIGSAANSAWVIAEFSGVHGTPYDISNGQFQATSTNSYTTPSITPTTGNRLLVAMMGGSHNSNLSTNTWGTWLNSFTGIDSIGSGGVGTNDCVGLAYRLVTGDGSTGYSSGATSSAVTFQAKSGLIISFKEAAGGAAYTLTAAQGTFALSGQAATLRYARKLVAATGARTLTGVAANLRLGRKVTAAAGSFSLTGVAANFKRTYALAAATGSFVLSGKNAGLAFGHRLTASTGSFTLTGQSAGLRFDRKLTAEAGAFALTGVNADLVYASVGTNYTLTAATGSFTLTGQETTLRSARKLASSAGSFALTGQDAGLKHGRKIAAAQGSFALTGNDAGLIYTPVAGWLTAEVGAFVLAGQPANLVFSHSPVFIDDVGGFDRRQAEHVKREKNKRLDRERLSDAIDRAFARIERNENLTYEQVEKAEAVIERIEASSEEIEKPDISRLIDMLDQIGKKLKKVEQDRAIARLKRFEDEMDEDSSLEALMLVA